ncbi:hypothetical protein [Buchnera aphidicola]|uniref:hypothetical protein n=1 Tax=Buchnera aphidicola TaxID=9 RepID=UPI0011D13DA5|nr:hypothetical protein [Buchnera aphidicola]
MIKNVAFPLLKNKTLYICDIQNNTNNNLNVIKTKNILIKIFNQKHGMFSIIQNKNIQKIKKKLNISPKDTLVNCNKALLISKKAHANYLLFSSTKYQPSNKKLFLEIQLIDVTTGEIIWTFNTLIKTILRYVTHKSILK